MKGFCFLALIILVGACTAPEENEVSELPPPNILFCIADDWSYPHAGVYGDRTLRTPTFDALAAGGMLFTNAYCASPSCSPSRASILTGRYPHQNGVAGNLWSIFPRGLGVYTEKLSEAGYAVGSVGKGWAPGNWEDQGWQHNPAGKQFSDFKTFLDQSDNNQPFCFWFGSYDPHREYQRNLGVHTGMHPDSVQVPGFHPDIPSVRNNIMNYNPEVERFDRNVGQMINLLRTRDMLDNTIIVVTSDNGMPFPRAKANVYDYGARMPLVVHWPARIPPGTVRKSFVSLASLAPTFIDAAQLSIPESMMLPSLLPQLLDIETSGSSSVIIERERHAQVRADSGSYAIRALRTDSFLYIRNYYPNRWPAGDPQAVLSVGAYGDVDNSISKMLILDGQKPAEDTTDYFRLHFDKRPGEELYAISRDPFQLTTLALQPKYEPILRRLSAQLDGQLRETNDPRVADPQVTLWDTARYTPTYGKRSYDQQAYINNYSYGLPGRPGQFTYHACQ